MNRRRKSVFAESYEPGEENAAVEKVASLFGFFFYQISDQHYITIVVLLMFIVGYQ